MTAIWLEGIAESRLARTRPAVPPPMIICVKVALTPGIPKELPRRYRPVMESGGEDVVGIGNRRIDVVKMARILVQQPCFLSILSEIARRSSLKFPILGDFWTDRKARMREYMRYGR
jgi:hypothetical protein